MRRWIALACMVMTVSGCENVAWGGVEVALQAPLPKAQPEVPDEAAEEANEEANLPPLPTGPLLLAGTRDGSSATLVLVGEIQPDGASLAPAELASESYRERVQTQLLAPGTEFALFAEGVRVGRLIASETGVDTRFCLPRPTVTGLVELNPAAMGAPRFLAVPVGTAEGVSREGYRGYSDDYDQRTSSLSLAARAITVVSAAWPPSLLESRADIQAFRLPEAGEPSFVATFLHQDRMAVSEPGPGGYALLVVGEPRGSGYGLAYTWYRRVADDGKGAPRYYGHLDWDGDGSSEILLDVFGTETRWFAGLDRQDGTWTRGFEDTCGGGPTTADQ